MEKEKKGTPSTPANVSSTSFNQTPAGEAAGEAAGVLQVKFKVKVGV